MNTKYPVLPVHGLGMKDTFFMKSFGKIDRILRIQGYTVVKSRIDGFGSVENNAIRLRDGIERLLIEHRAEKVNIIAPFQGRSGHEIYAEHAGNGGYSGLQG